MKNEICPCGSGEKLESCCGRFLGGKFSPETPEQLMRSRYTAYVKADIEYLRKTLAPESSGDFDAKTTREWAEQSTWEGLEILGAEKDWVEFKARYKQKDQPIIHHERSRFRKSPAGQWLFVEGQMINDDGQVVEPIVRGSPKVGRNDPCPCGSGKKFKKCCAA